MLAKSIKCYQYDNIQFQLKPTINYTSCQNISKIKIHLPVGYQYHNVLFQFLFQKLGVKSTMTVNNSRRPTSIRKEHSHLARSDRELQVIGGPMMLSDGPALPIQLRVILTELTKSVPHAVSTKVLSTDKMIYRPMNASTVTRFDCDKFTPSIRRESTALG